MASSCLALAQRGTGRRLVIHKGKQTAGASHRNSAHYNMKRLQTLVQHSSVFSRLSFNGSSSISSLNHDRRLTSSAVAKQFYSSQKCTDLYLPGSKLHLEYRAQDATASRPLAVQIVKRFEPFTSAVVLLIRRISDNKQFILKLNDRRLGHRHSLEMREGELPWTPVLEEHLRAGVCNIQSGKTNNWFEVVEDITNPALPDPDDWEDWMWEISTWNLKMQQHQNEVAAYRLLRHLQGHLIPRFYGLVRLPISFSEPLHPITDYVSGIVIECIQGVSMGSLRPGIDIPRPEAEAIADRVMDAFCTIKAEKCVMHNDIHIDNVLLRDSDRSPVVIDFGSAITRVPGMNDEEWEDSVAGCPDTRYMRRVLMSEEHGVWRRKETPFPMHYQSPKMWNAYVETQPESYRREMFERVPGTDWEGAGERVFQWRMRPGALYRDDIPRRDD